MPIYSMADRGGAASVRALHKAMRVLQNEGASEEILFLLRTKGSGRSGGPGDQAERERIPLAEHRSIATSTSLQSERPPEEQVREDHG